jgi:hypothetical protein
MTSSHDRPAHPADPTTPDPRPARPRARRAATLLAAAVPVAMASAAAPPAASTTRPGQTHAADLLTAATLPATTAGTGCCDPKIPAMVGD